MRTARSLLGKTLRGSALTRRERKQLLRTVSDLFRLVPFSMFVIIPFMEFALPFALRIFPNLLPSTFQDSLKAEENMKRELQSRIAMAHFFQEYVFLVKCLFFIRDSWFSLNLQIEERWRNWRKNRSERPLSAKRSWKRQASI